MTISTRSLVLLSVAAIGCLVLPSCDASQEDSVANSQYGQLAEPLLIISEGGDLNTRWAAFEADSVVLDMAEPETVPIPGFEEFNNLLLVLSDGRIIIRGRWDGDAILSASSQRNPASLQEGEANPVLNSSVRPVRLFVFGPATSMVTPLSHVPNVFPYSTAVLVGEAADVVLDVAVLRGEQAIAYVTGFSGAAYELPREIYVAAIPPKAG